MIICDLLLLLFIIIMCQWGKCLYNIQKIYKFFNIFEDKQRPTISRSVYCIEICGSIVFLPIICGHRVSNIDESYNGITS